jgi:cryptochrome
MKLLEKVGPPPAAVEAPSAIPPPHPDAWDRLAGAKGPAVPTLAELGYPEPEHPRHFTGGESSGLAILEKCIAKRDWVAKFEKPLTAPTDFEPSSTTTLSPYLKFGCVSARLFHSKVVEIYRSAPKSSKPPVSLEVHSSPPI